MQISVIMPVFNRPVRIERAVRSVLEQQGPSFELILVDDCSTEPNEALYVEIEALGHTVLRSKVNSGPGFCRNLGAQVAVGEWLAFLDSDDYWLPGKLTTHLAHLEASGLEIGQTEEVWYRHGERVVPPKQHRITGGDIFGRSLRAVCVSSSSVMLTREFFQSLGGFEESLFVCEDYDLWLKASALAEFGHCPQELVVKYGGHPDQLSGALLAMDRFRIWAIVHGLAKDLFQLDKSGQRLEKVLFELNRKLRILSKGSHKRGRDRAVSLCESIRTHVEQGLYEESLKSAEKLKMCWAQTPADAVS